MHMEERLPLLFVVVCSIKWKIIEYFSVPAQGETMVTDGTRCVCQL